MTSLNLYILETDKSISCLQEKCTYKFRTPKDKHKSIMQHYRTFHKDIYKQLKYQTKPYSKPLTDFKYKTLTEKQKKTLEYDQKDQLNIKNNIFDFDKESLKDKITNMNEEDLKQLQNSILHTKQITKEYFKNKQSFCFHYFVKTDYFIFKFIKEFLFIKMIVYNYEDIITLDKINDLEFSYSFLSINNDTSFTFQNDFKYMILNIDVKEVKIYHRGKIIFETSDFIKLLK